jgi:hypothetical protein
MILNKKFIDFFTNYLLIKAFLKIQQRVQFINKTVYELLVYVSNIYYFIFIFSFQFSNIFSILNQ